MLQNALGGNSKTIMIAAISPADVNFEESYSTLLYANQVKSIKNKAKINENPKDKFIRELREENERLKNMIENKQTGPHQNYDGKALLINLNDDPFLTGKLKHIVNDGMNVVGKPKAGLKTDIPIQGLGVVPDQNKISYDEKSGIMYIHPNENPKKNKTLVNGKLLTSDT